VSVTVYPSPEELARATAEWLRERAQAAGERFAVCLAGGSTPRRVYELLAAVERRGLPWDRVHWFFGDERFVPHDHPESNYRMARETLFDAAPVPAANVHPMPTAGLPAQAAQRYENELRVFYGAPILDPQRPLFDVVLLGLGADGHTASLFPGAAALQERRRWVVDVLNFQGRAAHHADLPGTREHPRLDVPGGWREEARHFGAGLGRRGLAGGAAAGSRGAGLVC
jgi:6-phosphogluconolactonase